MNSVFGSLHHLRMRLQPEKKSEKSARKSFPFLLLAAYFGPTDVEVEKLLSLLNPNKSTGPDGIGNWVLKNCSHTLANPLTKLFNNLLEKGSFPEVWKTANVCPVHKKGNKSEISNYRPISLLCNMSKVLEKVVYKRLYDYLMENNLLIEQNSGFKKNDSTINQLLKIVHQIYVDINEGKDTCLVFLDVSKAFDKVWIDGLLFKIQQLGIVGKLFDWIKAYVSGRHQKVVLNGFQSNTRRVTAGVPQGSILGPLLFLIYVNDITENMECIINLFADDTSVQQRINNVASFEIVNRDLQRLTSYGAQWLVKFNATKTDYIIITRKRNRPNHPNLILNGETISESQNHTHLGVTLNNKLSWSVHINMAIAKADRRLSVIRRCRNQIPRPCRETLYKTIIRPVLDYGDIIYDSCLKSESDVLEKFQRKCALVCSGAFKITSHEKLLKELGWSKLESRRSMHRLTLFYKIANSLTPSYLQQTCRLIPHNTNNYRLRRNNSFLVPFIRKEIFSKSYFPKTIREWNNMSNEIKASGSLNIFKSKLKEIYEPNKSNPLFGYGHGWSKINHCRIRLGLSHLRKQLFTYHLIESPFCEKIECNNIPETPKHFFLECPKYFNQRRKMLQSITDLMCPGVHYNTVMGLLGDYFCKILLEGSTDLSLEDNMLLFDIVFRFIDESGRFDHQNEVPAQNESL